jgi:4-amino-4-deoxy-L-arabinose transferase-like glycosyltransferase
VKNNSIHQEPQSAATPAASRIAIFFVLCLFAAVYFGSAFTPGLQDDADSTHAEAAREMAISHDYVTLKVNGNRYLEKAPLMYWLLSFSFSAFGVNEFAVRVPTVLAMLGLVLLAMAWGRRAFGERAGIYVGLFVATGAGYYLFTRILIPEAILSFFIAGSFYCFLTALEDGDAWRWYGGYVCLALAVLTKGLLALVVVGFAMLVFLAVSGTWREWRRFRITSGLVLFFAIAAPWHVLAGLRNPHFFWFYFVNEHFMRFLGKRIPMDYNKQESSLYWSLHLVWLFPWSLYLPAAVRSVVSRWSLVVGKDKAIVGGRSKAPTSRAENAREMGYPESQNPHPNVAKNATLGWGNRFRVRTELVCFIWAGVTLVFFSFSTNQEYYTFPAYFPILLLIAGELVGEEEAGSRWLLWTSAVLAVLTAIFAVVLGAGLWSSRHLAFVPDIGTVLAKPDLQAETLSMGHILDLTGDSFAALRLPAVMAAVVLLIGPALAVWFRVRRRHRAAMWATAVTMALFLIAAHIALVRFDPYLGSKVIAEDLKPQVRPDDRVMIYGDQAFGSSLLFYLRRPLELVNGDTTSMWWGSTYPDAPKIFLDDAGLRRAWDSGTRVFLFVPQHERARVENAIPGRKVVVSEHSGKVVYSNR